MNERPPAEPWTSAAWRGKVDAWIDEELDRLGLTRVGPTVQPHVRHWSTVMRVPAMDGDVFFKATVVPFEIELTEALARWRADCMLSPLATRAQEGWMLMPDGGPRLRETLQALADLWHWDRLLELFADVQLDLSARTTEMIGMEVPDRRLSELPRLYDELLNDSPAMRLGQPEGVSIEELSSLRDLEPRIADLCDRLAGLGVPESLHHGDFHDGNIFFRDGHHLLFDWGDACVAHPFFSAVAAMRNVEDRFALSWRGPELTRLRDTYLARWGRWGSPSDLIEAFEIATRLTLICGALGWQPYVPLFPDEFPDAVSTWLQELLDVMPAIG